ncbi:hypothetical protein MKY64_29420 [Paenibacillus sp. FSL R7-0210]|uniref:hypothetical protein n=1 Tax=Paenibacillus sp. FSL R7-0210 TaxID=2921676 RepID=UPI0030F759C1
MFKKVLLISVLTMSMLITAGPVNANPKEQPVNEQTDVVWVSGNAAALVDHVNNKADIVDLHTNTATTISEDSSRILDLQVMSSPPKIVLLKQGKGTKISKSVFSSDGRLLSKTDIPLKTAGDKVKWVAPTGKTNERIMVQARNNFSLYQYPWAKPSVTYNAKFIDKGYENVSVMDWDFQAYPYLAVKYQAQGIMSTDYLVKLVNLYSRNETVIKDFNTDFSIHSSGNFYAAYTSYTYQPVPGNVSRPSADEAQKVFQLISKSTSKETASVKQVFKEDGDISGWVTEVINGQVFVGDLQGRSWSLFSQGGAALLKNQEWPKNGNTKFLYANIKSKTAYFLDYSSGDISVIASTLK